MHIKQRGTVNAKVKVVKVISAQQKSSICFEDDPKNYDP